MPHYGPDSVENYTLGASRVWFSQGDYTNPAVPTYGGYVSLGNVVSAAVQVQFASTERYNALVAAVVPDQELIRVTGMSATLTLDETFAAQFARSLFGDPSGVSFSPGLRVSRGRAVLRGVSDIGNEYQWNIHDCTIVPSGNFDTNFDGWNTLEYTIRVNPVQSPANQPFGQFIHHGVGAGLADTAAPT